MATSPYGALNGFGDSWPKPLPGKTGFHVASVRPIFALNRFLITFRGPQGHAALPDTSGSDMGALISQGLPSCGNNVTERTYFPKPLSTWGRQIAEGVASFSLGLFTATASRDATDAGCCRRNR